MINCTHVQFLVCALTVYHDHVAECCLTDFNKTKWKRSTVTMINCTHVQFLVCALTVYHDHVAECYLTDFNKTKWKRSTVTMINCTHVQFLVCALTVYHDHVAECYLTDFNKTKWKRSTVTMINSLCLRSQFTIYCHNRAMKFALVLASCRGKYTNQSTWMNWCLQLMMFIKMMTAHQRPQMKILGKYEQWIWTYILTCCNCFNRYRPHNISLFSRDAYEEMDTDVNGWGVGQAKDADRAPPPFQWTATRLERYLGNHKAVMDRLESAVKNNTVSGVVPMKR